MCCGVVVPFDRLLSYGMMTCGGGDGVQVVVVMDHLPGFRSLYDTMDEFDPSLPAELLSDSFARGAAASPRTKPPLFHSPLLDESLSLKFFS